MCLFSLAYARAGVRPKTRSQYPFEVQAVAASAELQVIPGDRAKPRGEERAYSLDI